MSFTEWNEIMKGRKNAAKNLPHLLRLKVVPSARDFLLRFVKNGDSVLDIGANDRNIGEFLSKKGLQTEYLSFDVDRTTSHDYYDLDSVDRQFDIIVAFEVIEHMSVKEVIGCFRKAYSLLKPGGVFIVSTPNVCNPVVFWRDCTHTTPFRYDELYGILSSGGFKDIEVLRCGKYGLKEKILALYYRPLLKLMRMDFAPGIVAAARR